MEDEFSKEIKMGFIFLKDVIDISVYVIKGFIFPLHCNYNYRCIFGFANCTKCMKSRIFVLSNYITYWKYHNNILECRSFCFYFSLFSTFSFIFIQKYFLHLHPFICATGLRRGNRNRVIRG